MSNLSAANLPVFQGCVNDYMLANLDRFPSSEIALMAGVLDLYVHKNPRMRILELGDSSIETTKSLLRALDVDSPMQKHHIFEKGDFSDDGELVRRACHTNENGIGDCEINIISDKQFDLILLLQVSLGQYEDCAWCLIISR